MKIDARLASKRAEDVLSREDDYHLDGQTHAQWWIVWLLAQQHWQAETIKTDKEKQDNG